MIDGNLPEREVAFPPPGFFPLPPFFPLLYNGLSFFFSGGTGFASARVYATFAFLPSLEVADVVSLPPPMWELLFFSPSFVRFWADALIFTAWRGIAI